MKKSCNMIWCLSLAFLLIKPVLVISAPSETKYMKMITPGTVTTNNTNWTAGSLGDNKLVYWPISTITWNYNVGDSQDTEANSLNALRTAFSQWDNVSDAILSFSEGQSIPSPTVSDEANNTITIFFESDNTTLNDLNFTTTRLGSTFYSTKNSSSFLEIEDVDIVLNARNYTWTAGTTNVESDSTRARIQVLATHEIGHALGLHHHGNSSSTSIMNNALPLHNMTSYSINSDDEFAVSFVRGGHIIDNYTLMNGTYYSNWDTVIDSTLTLVGYGADATLQVAPSKTITVNGTLSLSQSRSKITKKETSKWGGIIINSGGTLLLTGDNIIEEATTGVTINGNSSTPINNGANTLTIQYCGTGLYAYNCSPTVGNILFYGNTGNAIEVDYNTSDPTLQRSCVSDTTVTDHAIYINNAADMTLQGSILGQTGNDTILLETAAAINTNNTNNIDHRSGYYPIDNTTASTHGYLDIRNTYWYGTTDINSIVSDYSSSWVTYSPIAGSAYTSNVGTYKPAVLAESGDLLEKARELEDGGFPDDAKTGYKNVVATSDNETHKRVAFKRMVRIAGMRKQGYDDIVTLMETELKTAEGWYRAYLDCALCDIMAKEGRYREAVSELERRSAQYSGSPTEAEMLAEMANIAGVKLDDTYAAKSYADRAAALNPGQSSLRIAYAAAGIDYEPEKYTDRFAEWDGAFQKPAAPEATEEATETVTPTLSITPNPANPMTTIVYTLPNARNVSLTVYSISGQKVATLADGFMEAGSHSAVFDGAGLASGVYIYRFRTQGFNKTGKIMLVK